MSSLVDSTDSLGTLLNTLTTLPVDPPCIYIDLEGAKLSRTGSISLILLFLPPKDHVYLIDVFTLGNATFTTAGKDTTTLKDIFESATIPKVFFDVRNDSDVLYAHIGIALQGIQDIQLMENTSRSGTLWGKRLLHGLAKCIETDAPLSASEKQKWKDAKERALTLFAPEKGGSYELFDARPLADDITGYCIQDVRFLPRLRDLYLGRLTQVWKSRVETETLESACVPKRGLPTSWKTQGLGPW
jgi:exonuclease 3'-5' domain-containing protein 1